MTEPQLMVVGTPIGNLGDWSPRAQTVLGEVALIACEDTRRTGSLLARHDISNPGMVVMNEHTEKQSIDRVLETLHAGRSVAVVTDAGMPTISDPGALVVAAASAAGFDVVVVPGPTAVSSALALSGFASGRYVFEGFLPRKGAARAQRLGELATEARIVVLYEAPHRLVRTLDDLAEHLDGDRLCVVARELTKLHEEVWRGTLSDAGSLVRDPRGEYVIVIDTAPAPPEVDDEVLAEAVANEQLNGMSTRDAAATVAKRFGVGRRRVYELATRLAN